MSRVLSLLIGVLIFCVCVLGLAEIASASSGASLEQTIARSQQLTLRGEWDRAAKELLQRISLATRAGDGVSVSRLRTEYARVLMDRNFFYAQNRAAVSRAIEEAEEAAKAANDRQSLADLLQYKAQVRFSEAFSNDDFETPRKMFLEALSAREALGDKRRLAETYFYVGVSYEQGKKPAEALPYYRKSLQLAEESGDKAMQSYPHRHIGGLNEEAGKLDSAYEHITRSLALRREAGFTVGVPFAMLQLVDFIAKHRGERERAIKMTEEAIDLAEASHSARAQYFAQLTLAQLEAENKQLRPALSYAECAVEGARKFGEPGDVKIAEQQLAEIRSKM